MLTLDERTTFVTVTANVGARIRDGVSTFANLQPGPQVAGGLGVAVRPGASSRLNLTADAFAGVPLVSREGTESPVTLEGFLGRGTPPTRPATSRCSRASGCRW